MRETIIAALLLLVPTVVVALSRTRNSVPAIDPTDPTLPGSGPPTMPGPTTGGGGPSPSQIAAANQLAMLRTIMWAEGTLRERDPYRVSFGYQYVIQDLSDHPINTGEYYLHNDKIVHSASGAYQFVIRSWNEVKSKIGLRDFSPSEQDRAAIWTIRTKRRVGNALDNGNMDAVLDKLSYEWASLPDSSGSGRYNQPIRTLSEVKNYYKSQGGYFDYEI